MEASGAGVDGTTQTDTAPAAEAQPNGLVLVCGQFDPLAVVELVERRQGEFRSENDRPVLGRRTVDEDGNVGFSGLEVGGSYFVTGYTGGRYQEVRAVAQDPALAIVGFQSPSPPPPLMVGTANTPAAAVVPALPETPTEGEGIPEEAQAVLDEGAAAAAEVPQETPEEAAAREAHEAAEAQAEATTPVTPIGSPPVDEANPPAPEAGTPDASDSSGTGQANGGAVEQEGKVGGPSTVTIDGEPQTVESSTAQASTENATATTTVTETAPASPVPDPSSQASSDAEPAADAPPASAPAVAEDSAANAEPAGSDAETSQEQAPAGASVDGGVNTPEDASADATAPVEATPAPDAAVEASPETEAAPPADVETDWTRLVKQAGEVGVENASNLSDAELRQAITEKNATPVV